MVIKKKNARKLRKAAKKERRIKPELPGGFRDYGLREAIARAQMIKTIRKTFESFGFDPLETSSVQRTEVLTGGEADSGKIIFNVKGSQEEKSDNSLRFDLTVPLARFVAANPDISKPFKRYEIGRVWRGESPQAGRYREFMQADIDIIGSSSMNADAEIIIVIYTTLKNLGIDNFKIKINSRKLLNALPQICGFPARKIWAVLRIIDKADKIGWDTIFKKLRPMIGVQSAQEVKKLMNLGSRDITQISLNGEIIAQEGSRDLCTLGQYLENFGLVRGKYWDFDISIVRGLGYYTGIVCEVILTDIPEIGSIFSGGRYDNLVSQFTGKKIPSVGASIGIDRLFAAQEKLGLIKKQQTTTNCLVFNVLPELMSDYVQIVKQLRDADINTSFYLGDDTSFQAQLSYAVKKEIPFVIIYGEEEAKKGVVAVKNLVTREQKEVKREKIVNFFDEQFGKK
mgnify:CR=1 FL=1